MILFKPKNTKLPISIIKKNNSFLNLETLTLNYVFFFPQYALTLVYPKTSNFIFDIRDTFYLKFPKFIIRYHTDSLSLPLEFQMIDIVGDKVLKYNKVIKVVIPDFIPSFYKDLISILYNSGAVTNFYTDIFFVSTLLSY